MKEFRTINPKILITYDSFSLDFQQVGLVINYDLPSRKEGYIKRIGRYDWNGKRGIAINILVPSDTNLLNII